MACAGCLGEAGDATGGLRVDAIEIPGAGFGEDADEVDDDIRPGNGGGDRGAVRDAALEGDDLADIARGLEEQGAIRPAHGDAHRVAGLCQMRDDVAPEEAGAAEDGRNAGCG